MLRTKIEDTLLSFGGCDPSILGFNYIVDATILAVEQPDALKSFTKTLYPTVANQNRSTSSRVERAIRHAIEKIYLYGDMERVTELLGNIATTNYGKPTNSAFISTFALKMKRSV